MVSADETVEIKTSEEQNELTPLPINPASFISGSRRQAFITNTFVTYISGSLLVVFNPLLPQTKLSPILASILAASPMVVCFMQIPISRKISRNGGKKEVIAIITSTLTGAAILTTLASLSDLNTVSEFDLRYGLMLTSGLMIGLGSSLYTLYYNSYQWVRDPKHIPIIQSIHSAVVGSANISTPIIMNVLGRSFGYEVPLAFYTGLIALSLIIAILFIQQSPYDQLKKHFSNEDAKKYASQFGQLETMMREDADTSILSIAKEHLQFCLDRRGITLYLAMLATLGNILMIGTIFPTLLKNAYGMDPNIAVYAASIASFIAILTRLIAGQMIARFDKDSGGIKVFCLGSLITAGSAIPLTFSNLEEWKVYLSTVGINVGLALSLIPILGIALNWSDSKNENLKKYNPVTAFGGLSTIGTLGGFIFPLLLGMLVDSKGEAGYQQYFYMMMTMMLTAGALIPAVDYTVRSKNECMRFFNKPMTLFGRNHLNNQHADVMKSTHNALSFAPRNN